MNIFDLAPATSEHIVKAFAAIEQEGLGARRRRAGLLDVEKQKNSLVLTPNDSEVSRVQVDFKTPTELKNKNEIAARPEFPILFARISERLNALQTFYGTEPLEAIPACAVRMTECTIVQSQVERRSSKTGQRHRIGGFTGAAISDGDLRECLPLLRAAEFTGVGRHTAWGNGRLVVTVI
jgi:CRISPR/Cas system endoribonuclease Cas6 (RAMP superfamily)